jgi:hypothetical protein
MCTEGVRFLSMTVISLREAHFNYVKWCLQAAMLDLIWIFQMNETSEVFSENMKN